MIHVKLMTSENDVKFSVFLFIWDGPSLQYAIQQLDKGIKAMLKPQQPTKCMVQNDLNLKLQTLVFIKKDNYLLLGRKLRGFGMGKWNGYGGKQENDEEIKSCARRELFEESRLHVDENDLIDVGYIQFLGLQGMIERRVHIFTCYKVDGVEVTTEEMTPKWFKHDEIPFDQMWDDCRYWMKYVLHDKYFNATFQLDNTGKISQYNIVD